MWHLTWKIGSKLHDVTREESGLLCGQKKITRGLEKIQCQKYQGTLYWQSNFVGEESTRDNGNEVENTDWDLVLTQGGLKVEIHYKHEHRDSIPEHNRHTTHLAKYAITKISKSVMVIYQVKVMDSREITQGQIAELLPKSDIKVGLKQE